MPKTKISEYSATANSNTDVASINIDEGCAPSGINNAIRAVMGHLKDFQQGTNGDPFNGPVNGTVGATTPSTGAFTTLSASSTVTLSGGTANGVAYLNGSKVVTTGSALGFDGTNLLLGTPSVLTSGKFSLQADLSAVNAMTLRDSGTAYGVSSYYTLYQNSAGSTVGGIGHTAVTSLGINATTDLQFFIAASEKMRISGATGGVGAVGIGYTSLTSVGDNGLAVLGNVGIGTSSPAGKLTVDPGNTSGTQIDGLRLPKNFTAQANFVAWQQGANGWRVGMPYNDGTYPLAFYYGASTPTASSPGTQLMTLDASGNLLVGKTNTTGVNAGAVLTPSGGFTLTRTGTAASDQVVFYRGTAGSEVYVGTITTTGTATSYVTSSDYRLKNTIAPMTGALAKVAALKPVTYKWNADGSDGEGFIAHELAEVCPHAVTGEKDAVDENGKPKYQGIDTSFLVATLTAAIQELKAEIDSLKSQLNGA